MRIVILFFFVLCGCTNYKYYGEPVKVNPPAYTDDCFSEGGKIIIEGRYMHQNLYCLNPLLYCTDSTKRFATIDITINDSILIPYDSLASSAYEIPLSQYHFIPGDSLHIVIRHVAGGTPKLLNPEVR